MLRLLAAGGWHPSDLVIDNAVSLVGLLVVTLFAYHAGREVYGGSRPAGLAKGLVLAASIMLIVQIYRGFLFFVTYYTL